MSIKEFGKALEVEIRENLGSGYNIEYKEVVKNNGVTYHAILIKEISENIAPTIYIDGFYKSYLEGSLIMGIANEIIRLYKDNIPANDFDISCFTDFAKASRHLSFKVVGFEKNKKELAEIPYKRIEDLAMIPICIVSDVSMGNGNIVIKNEHLKVWEISFDELWENVYESAQWTAPVSVEGLLDTVEGMMCEEDRGLYHGPFKDMYVVTNTSKIYGASAIFYPGCMEKLARKVNGNLVILPSSVHETIVLRAPENKDELRTLLAIVREVNSSVVCAEEVLSENIYLYDLESKKLSVLEQ